MTDTAMKVSKTLTDSWSNLERKTRESIFIVGIGTVILTPAGLEVDSQTI
jgi:hypothetical protein